MQTGNEQRKAMLALIEEWHQSGMAQKDFYQQRNIPAHIFYYWHRCYRKQKGALPKSKAISRFVELKPSAALTATNIELLLSQGHRIIFHQPVSAAYLKSLIG